VAGVVIFWVSPLLTLAPLGISSLRENNPFTCERRVVLSSVSQEQPGTATNNQD
jgi:hypothetical protein